MSTLKHITILGGGLLGGSEAILFFMTSKLGSPDFFLCYLFFD
jgi:hypothetical protein